MRVGQALKSMADACADLHGDDRAMAAVARMVIREACWQPDTGRAIERVYEQWRISRRGHARRTFDTDLVPETEAILRSFGAPNLLAEIRENTEYRARRLREQRDGALDDEADIYADARRPRTVRRGRADREDVA